MRRWAKPVIPILVENDVEKVEVVYSGIAVPRLMHRARMVLKDEDVQRIRNGYVCINCQEPFERPYPDSCVVCGFEVRKYQDRMFQTCYEGYEAPPTPLADKLDVMDDLEAKEKRDKEGKDNSRIQVA